MNIGDVARQSGLPAKTIRYYEDIELVKPSRSMNGYRIFGDNDLHRLAFVGRARSLGFTIEDCRNLLKLYGDEERASSDVKRIAQEHLKQMDVKLNELTGMIKTLSHLIEACAGDHRPDCPILADLGSPRLEDADKGKSG
jgi:MerR family copper efflux transcriptional regulator